MICPALAGNSLQRQDQFQSLRLFDENCGDVLGADDVREEDVEEVALAGAAHHHSVLQQYRLKRFTNDVRRLSSTRPAISMPHRDWMI